MLKPGEQVVAATQFRDFVLVFGSYGTILRIFWDYDRTDIKIQHEIDLGTR